MTTGNLSDPTQNQSPAAALAIGILALKMVVASLLIVGGALWFTL